MLFSRIFYSNLASIPGIWQGRGTDRDLHDAVAGLNAFATGESPELDDRGRARAGHLATVVQRRLS
jgi:hypothetical protein